MSGNEYIVVLRDSLKKKIEILNSIIVRNEEQRKIFESDESTPDELDNNIEAKSILIEQLESLDDGFEELFASVSEELEANKETYADDIRQMQDYVRTITELSTKVSTQEQRNRNLAVSFFARKKRNVKQVRKGTEAVNQYYQSMMRVNTIDPRFMDKKK